ETFGISKAAEDIEPSRMELDRMKYIDCVIKEGLRLYPPVPYTGRLITENIQIGDYILPKGVTVYQNIRDLHRDADVFPEPDKFDPERSNNNKSSSTTQNETNEVENSKSDSSNSTSSFTFLPFSAGLRNCIGQKFAMMELRMILAKIVHHFDCVSLDAIDSVATMP